MDIHTDPPQPEFSGGYDPEAPRLSDSSKCWQNFGQVVSSQKVIVVGGGLSYQRRVVSLSTWLDLEAYRLAVEENGGGSGVYHQVPDKLDSAKNVE